MSPPDPAPAMVRVRLFASLREAAGWSETPNWCEWVNVGIGVVGAALGASVARGPTHARAKSGSRSKSRSSAE